MKIIKLSIIAVLIIGAIYALLTIKPKSPETSASDTDVEVTSVQAKEWKTKIEQLCQDGKWSTEGYQQIEDGIRMDRKTSKGDLINDDEERVLKKYLFSLSCSSLFGSADKHFQQSTYSDKKIQEYENAVAFLEKKVPTFGTNSNLTETAALLSGYKQILQSLVGFGSSARYSNPLRAFSGHSAEAQQRRIRGMKYFQSHYVKNSRIKAQVANLLTDRNRAEQQYYHNLERAIEQHYTATGDLVRLLEDQIRFNKISTNESAKERLAEFVTNINN